MKGMQARRLKVKFTGETCPRTHFILAEILVLVGGTIPPVPAVLASTRIAARLKRVQKHSSHVNANAVGPSSTRTMLRCIPRVDKMNQLILGQIILGHKYKVRVSM